MTELASFALRALVLLDTDTLPQPSTHPTDETAATGIRQLFLQHGLAIIDSLLPTPTSEMLVTAMTMSSSSNMITYGGSNRDGSSSEGEEDEGLMGLETLDWVSACVREIVSYNYQSLP